MIEQGNKYAHKGKPVIALESGSAPFMVKVLPVPKDTYKSSYYVLARDLVPMAMKYYGGAVPELNDSASRAFEAGA